MADFEPPYGFSEGSRRVESLDRRAELAIESADRGGDGQLAIESANRGGDAQLANNETPRAFPVMPDVIETVEVVARDTHYEHAMYSDGFGQSAYPYGSRSARAAQIRADIEAVPLLRSMEAADPGLRDQRLGQYEDVMNASQLASRTSQILARVRGILSWTKMAGEVVSLERVYQPVPVVVGAVPARAGASGELTAEFERSRSGGIEVAVAAASGSFSVSYSISDERSVVLDENPTGDLVVAFGELLIPLDRQILLVPMVKGGEPLLVERYLPVRGSQDAIGWNARAGTRSEVDDLRLDRFAPLRGTLPQNGSKSMEASVEATVSLGWGDTATTLSAKASLGVSAKVTLGSTWRLPPGDFTLDWAQRTMVGAVIRE